jgi:transposase
MQIVEYSPGDVDILIQKIRSEKNAKQRDRYRAVAMAIEGMQTKQIMKKLDRSKNFVQRWNYFYRDGGIEAIAAKLQTGRPTKLDPNEESVFKKRITAGPVESDEVCTFVGRDAKSILEKEFGVKYSLPGAYALMHRLGLSCLMPRPKHRKNDPEKMQQWLEDAPFLSKKSEKATPAKKSKYGSRMKSE